MFFRQLLAGLTGSALCLAAPVLAQPGGGDGQSASPQVQPTRPSRPEIQPPRPRPEIQPPRPGPEIQPPRPGRPEPPRPPRPEPPRPPRPIPPRPPIQPPRPPIVQHRLSLYPLLLGLGRASVFTSDVRDLSRFGANNRALSLVAVGRWQVCSEARYRGRCQTVSGRVTNLSRIGLGRTISSVRFLGR